ncbi:MAG: alpha/beta fold hydrolase [Thermodesulfobacteriota bacterium]
MAVAVLLLHGFGGEPFEMLGLAAALEAAGCATSVPLLPGHGTSVQDWAATGFSDWLAAAEAEYLRLAREHGQVFCCGLSMGGSLCLALGQRHRPAGIATLAAPVFLYRFFPYAAADWRLPFLPLLRRVRPFWPMSPRSETSLRRMPWRGYEGSMSLAALASFVQGLKAVRQGLGLVRSPLLVVHAERDGTTPPANAREIMRKAGSARKDLVLLPVAEDGTSHHVLTTHCDHRAKVEQLVLGFVRGLAKGEENSPESACGGACGLEVEA